MTEQERVLFDALFLRLDRIMVACERIAAATEPNASPEAMAALWGEALRIHEASGNPDAPVIGIVRDADAPVRRDHELVRIDGIPAETYPFLPTDPDADTQPIDEEEGACED